MEIFNEELNRLKLLSIKTDENNRKIKIAVHRNHSFEMVATVLNAFLDFSHITAEFLYSDYDDSLNFTEIAKDADLNIIWLDLKRYNNINIKTWLKERIIYLKNFSNSKILVYTTGEENLSDVKIPDVLIADSNNIQAFLKENYLDIAKEKYSGTRYSNKTCLYIARELGLIYIPSLLCPHLKAIILDLDNTLYNGVLGEDGIDGIKPYYELLSYLKTLKEKGFFLAVVSKNEYKDVENLFKTRNDLKLKLEDFSDIQANWNSKSENILNVAKNLNIGLDSMVFVDDNIGELEAIHLTLPQIKTIAATSETKTLNTLKFYPGLYKTEVTKEDKIRTKDIQANREREELMNNLSEEEYFKNLNICLTYFINQKAHLKRVVELLNKTNQFIFNYARFNETQINSIYNDPNSCIITVSMKDKLSDSGIIGIIVAHKENELAVIDELTISCRALGRNIENLLINKLFECVNATLLTKKLCLKYQKGERNMPALKWLSSYINRSITEPKGEIVLETQNYTENNYININIIK